MTRITCAISGLRFSCDHLADINIPARTGYFHPVFTLSQKTLYQLYYKHSRNQLTPTDSYLLFCAFLHSSGSINWDHPATCKPNDKSTKQLIQNNLAQLIRILEKTAVIKHPGFKQPKFHVTYENSNLREIPNWILAWEWNIELFDKKVADIRAHRSLQEVENRLTQLIQSGTDTSKFPHIVADWASQAADFPPAKDDEWRKVIRSCFNTAKMFNTPLATIKEVKDFCECNIQAGSIHFHTLCEVLKEGIRRHVDYLGGSSLARGYTLLPDLDAKLDREQNERELVGAAELATIIQKAPTEPPLQCQYPNKAAWIKAKLAYRVALIEQENAAKEQEIDL